MKCYSDSHALWRVSEVCPFEIVSEPPVSLRTLACLRISTRADCAGSRSQQASGLTGHLSEDQPWSRFRLASPSVALRRAQSGPRDGIDAQAVAPVDLFAQPFPQAPRLRRGHPELKDRLLHPHSFLLERGADPRAQPVARYFVADDMQNPPPHVRTSPPRRVALPSRCNAPVAVRADECGRARACPAPDRDRGLSGAPPVHRCG